MKTFKRIIVIILAIILLLILVAYILPKTYKVERSVYIPAKPELIYDLTSNFNKWMLWVPWTKELDSTAVFTLEGAEGQVGSVWRWDGKKMGNGQMTATKFVPSQSIEYDLEFDHGKYRSKGKILIEKDADSCKVSWIDEGDLGYNPINRYFGLLMDKMMGPDFQKGLEKLKSVCQSRALWPRIDEKVMPEQTVILVRDSAGPDSYSKVMNKGFTELMSAAKNSKLKIVGPAFAVYVKYDTVSMFGVFDMGFPVEKAEKGFARVRVEKIPAQKVVMAYYFGPYDKTADTYRYLDQYIKEAGLVQAGGPWEIYVSDPSMEKDPSKLETHIAFPVK
jgi:effector-binding domain-containing protein/uncharacterized protein YndB with AHSA1/START domain